MWACTIIRSPKTPRPPMTSQQPLRRLWANDIVLTMDCYGFYLLSARGFGLNLRFRNDLTPLYFLQLGDRLSGRVLY
jgi:hypothetical protein